MMLVYIATYYKLYSQVAIAIYLTVAYLIILVPWYHKNIFKPIFAEVSQFKFLFFHKLS